MQSPAFEVGALDIVLAVPDHDDVVECDSVVGANTKKAEGMGDDSPLRSSADADSVRCSHLTSEVVRKTEVIDILTAVSCGFAVASEIVCPALLSASSISWTPVVQFVLEQSDVPYRSGRH